MTGITVFATERVAELFSLASTLQTGPAADKGGSTLAMMVPLILVMVIFYFLMWRPESKRLKQHQAMLAALKKGDEVVLMNGIYGKIYEVSSNQIIVEIAKDVRVRVIPNAISGIVPQKAEDAPAK